MSDARAEFLTTWDTHDPHIDTVAWHIIASHAWPGYWSLGKALTYADQHARSDAQAGDTESWLSYLINDGALSEVSYGPFSNAQATTDLLAAYVMLLLGMGVRLGDGLSETASWVDYIDNTQLPSVAAQADQAQATATLAEQWAGSALQEIQALPAEMHVIAAEVADATVLAETGRAEAAEATLEAEIVATGAADRAFATTAAAGAATEATAAAGAMVEAENAAMRAAVAAEQAAREGADTTIEQAMEVQFAGLQNEITTGLQGAQVNLQRAVQSENAALTQEAEQASSQLQAAESTLGGTIAALATATLTSIQKLSQRLTNDEQCLDRTQTSTNKNLKVPALLLGLLAFFEAAVHDPVPTAQATQDGLSWMPPVVSSTLELMVGEGLPW